jgi:homoserine dehydrogenase
VSASASEVTSGPPPESVARRHQPLHAAPGRMRVGLLGCGRVGEAIVALAREQAQQAGEVELEFTAALVRDVSRRRAHGLPPVCASAEEFFAAAPDLVIEVIGGVEPAGSLVVEALARQIPVVTANKTLMAERGGELRALARANGVALAFDAAVVAGVPCLGALARRPSLRAPRAVTGILNGTTHYILHALASGGSFADALRQAQARGYAEADSTADISGQDAASKLAIVLQLAGPGGVTRLDFPTLGIDVITADDVQAARAAGGVLKPIALAVLDPERPGAWVGPAFVDGTHPAARSASVFNFLQLQYTNSIPITFSGPGAGARETAATVLDDVAEIAGGRPADVPVSSGPVRPEQLRQPPPGPWFIRTEGDVGPAALAELLALYHVPPLRTVRASGGAAAVTAGAEWAHVLGAAEVLRATGARVLTLPAIGGPDGE